MRNDEYKQENLYNLLLFPYSGVGASIYNEVKNHITLPINCIPVQLPGREELIQEKPYDEMNLLVDYLASHLETLTAKPLIFFGHCLGALIAYETALTLMKKNSAQVLHFFASASTAPNTHHVASPIHHLPSKQFLEQIQQRSYFRTKPTTSTVCKILLPGLRADFKLYETYSRKEATSLSCPITVMSGQEDDFIRHEQTLEWKGLTQGKFHTALFPGDHLYLHAAMPAIVKQIEENIMKNIQ